MRKLGAGCDFSGWATKNDLVCADDQKRIIRKNAFAIQDGRRVPLVWNHQRATIGCVLGHAILENRKDGVYAYGYFNNTAAGRDAKEAVSHGDVESLSIWANNLEQIGRDVIHGVIREVSLVLAGANPGAFIESVVAHGEAMEDGDDEGIFYTGEGLCLEHAIDSEAEDEEEDDEDAKKDEKPKTVQEVLETYNDEQKAALGMIVAQAVEDAKNEESEEDEEEEEDEMKHNLFEDDDKNQRNYISHADVTELLENAKRMGSLKAAIKENIANDGFLAHVTPTDGMTVATGTAKYGFNDPEMLYPDYKTVNGAAPEWISRNMDWVQKLMGAIHHTPFSRIRSLYADITEDDARARGYIKGKQKKEEVFTTLKRTTDAQMIYKLQKVNREDIIDINSFDIVAWVRAEMRVMLNEEIARAVLIGDGRASDSEFKISEEHIRPIAKDKPLYNTQVVIEVPANATDSEKGDIIVDEVIRARKNYKGSGNPLFFTTEDILTTLLLQKDKVGHRLYKTEAELATALRVREIVPVELLESYTLDIGTDTGLPLVGIMVNPVDYNIGTDKGGEITAFDDFDIDFNQYKYLIEMKISGALIKPFAALTFAMKTGTSVAG